MNPFRGALEAVALRFVDRINHGDVPGLEARMTDGHELRVFDEPPLRGRSVCADAWSGYAQSFPSYLIHPERLAVRGSTVAILGHTTGSHLGLPDEEESRLKLIWLAEVEGDLVSVWKLIADTPEHRRAFDFDGP